MLYLQIQGKPPVPDARRHPSERQAHATSLATLSGWRPAQGLPEVTRGLFRQ
ncbi:MAG: hypothetical protein ABGZ17_23935 [Planctomycetaceae bacterium]